MITPPRPSIDTLYPQLEAVLYCDDVEEKLGGTAALLQAWQSGQLPAEPSSPPRSAERPGRPIQPELVAPEAVPKRSPATPEGHAALIHAIAHIEFNAINLALDAAYRFRAMPDDYRSDWLQVAAEEAHHFTLLRDHLRGLGHDYGDFQGHTGLWDMAVRTADDVLARMALVPRLLEARGLDATPVVARKLRGINDRPGLAILDVILRDEVGHVRIGNRWFHHLCEQQGLEPVETFVALLRQHQAPPFRKPLNHEARAKAGFTPAELRLIDSLSV